MASVASSAAAASTMFAARRFAASNASSSSSSSSSSQNSSCRNLRGATRRPIYGERGGRGRRSTGTIAKASSSAATEKERAGGQQLSSSSSSSSHSDAQDDDAFERDRKNAFLSAVEKDKANVVPVFRRIFDDQLTPILAYRLLVKDDAREAPSFLFESVVGGTQIGRYSFLGRRPKVEV